MFTPRARAMVALAAIASSTLLAAGCGSSESDGSPDTTAAVSAAEPSGVSLKGVCPDTVVIQTDWFATPERAAAYQLVGPGGSVDTSKGAYTGPLGDTGVNLEVRFGGSFIGFTPIPQQMYTDKSIMLGLVATDDAVAAAEKFPTMAVVAPLDLNPQTITFDPDTYDISSWDDVAKTDATIIYIEGLPFMDYLVSKGYVDEDQLDPSFDGTPSRFIADDGKTITQEYGTNDYRWEHDYPGWEKPVKSLLVNDSGYQIYPQGYAVRSDELSKDSACLKELVPLIQQAQIDYVKDPKATNDEIIEISEEIMEGPTFTPEGNEAATKAMLDLEIVGNGTNDVFGDFDEDRVADTIEILKPIYAARDQDVPTDLKPEDLVTNEFIDDSIKL
ncbi:nitrate ABC transporter substrate-binding protein [soil metagenome]